MGVWMTILVIVGVYLVGYVLTCVGMAMYETYAHGGVRCKECNGYSEESLEKNIRDCVLDELYVWSIFWPVMVPIALAISLVEVPTELVQKKVSGSVMQKRGLLKKAKEREELEAKWLEEYQREEEENFKIALGQK